MSTPPPPHLRLGQNVYPPPPRTRSGCLPPPRPETWSECLPPPPRPGQDVYPLPPPETTRRRAVRILLECILVWLLFGLVNEVRLKVSE